MSSDVESNVLTSAFDSPTFGQDGIFHLDKPVGSASISPCGRDVVLASRQGLHIIDLDSPWSPPRHLPHYTPWEVADVQWSPFASRDYWVVSTSNQKALVWNLGIVNTKSSIEHVLHAHTRAITDINFSAHNPDILATCAIDSFIHCWDLRHPATPALTFCDWFAGATQVKWNRQNAHILASSHDKFLRIWDDRKGAYPLRTINAHITKIYGVDWSRTEHTSLVTCSLDRTIKFWNYENLSDEPDRVLQTPFPVWRARHTPFGFGLLAMPQRGDHDLHLYDRRIEEAPNQQGQETAVHRFVGHEDQVKEFLWRPRGLVSETSDHRDFQLVSWGTDRILRLHHVDDDVLCSVGYKKGINIERRMNITRKDAVYKTFRETPLVTKDRDNASFPENTDIIGGVSNPAMSAHPSGISRVSVPLLGGYGNVGFMSPLVGRKWSTSKEMDPIAWMRGVKIGQQDNSPNGLHHSISSIASPSLRAETWDTFDNLGDEIAHAGDKFKRVIFEEVDMQHRSVVISLSGPRGPENQSTYIKSRLNFPLTYPTAKAPTVILEATASLTDVTVTNITSGLSAITAAFLSSQRSSLEAVLRYLLGEQSLEESLSWMGKRQENVDLDSAAEIDISSSDEDDETFGNFARAPKDMESSDLMASKPDVQNSPPLPKACGAYWAEDGRLVCFFPPKQEQSSLLRFSLKANDRSSKNRISVFEGFGRFHDAIGRRRQAASTLETIESGSSEDFVSSSTDTSTSSDDNDLPQHHFLPWRGDPSEKFTGASVDESQKSSGDRGTPILSSSREKNSVSIHNFTDLLPAKASLAQKYILGGGSAGCAHNAQAARDVGNQDLAQVWSFVELLIQERVPLRVMHDNVDANETRDTGGSIADPVMIVAKRSVSKLKFKDSAIDLSFDNSHDPSHVVRSSMKWGAHPYGQLSLIPALFHHYEQTADVQMLAMLSCVFHESGSPSKALSSEMLLSGSTSSLQQRNSSLQLRASKYNYYASEEVAKACISSMSSASSPHAEYQPNYSGAHSVGSSIGGTFSDLSASNPISSHGILHSNHERKDSGMANISASPKHVRHMHRSNSNLSTYGTSLPRSFLSSISNKSSPPNVHPNKRPSPSESYLEPSHPNNTWNPADSLDRSSSFKVSKVSEPRSHLTLSMLEPSKNGSTLPRKPIFRTKLMNQDRFQNDGYANVPLLDPSQESRYRAYREAYAHLLYIWGLPTARCELLSYNTPLRVEISQPPLNQEFSPSVQKADLTDHLTNNADKNLDFKTLCKSCSTVLPYQMSKKECQNCAAKQTRPICLLCNTFIQGLSSPCLNCGHVLHISCRQSLASYPLDEAIRECISGCGCICADHTTGEIQESEKHPKLTQEDVSPALTVIGDNFINEQEQLGWYNNSEWEDMAYESLARNLKRTNEVRPKGSQIWRGRKGSR